MDNLTPEQRRKNMQNIRSKGTKVELLIARELRKRKIYFSSHSKNIPGKPDFVFRRKKVVVFVDSDFWHGHPRRFVMPKTNLEYWSEKIKRNKTRDKQVNSELRIKGWRVLRVWEHDVNKKFPNVIRKILKALDLSFFDD